MKLYARAVSKLGRRVFIERKSYPNYLKGGRSHYSWIYIEVINTRTGEYEIISVGDPWPCMHPKIAEVESAMSLAESSYYARKMDERKMDERKMDEIRSSN